jgi:hypothetical protein
VAVVRLALIKGIQDKGCSRVDVDEFQEKVLAVTYCWLRSFEPALAIELFETPLYGLAVARGSR